MNAEETKWKAFFLLKKHQKHGREENYQNALLQHFPVQRDASITLLHHKYRFFSSPQHPLKEDAGGKDVELQAGGTFDVANEPKSFPLIFFSSSSFNYFHSAAGAENVLLNLSFWLETFALILGRESNGVKGEAPNVILLNYHALSPPALMPTEKWRRGNPSSRNFCHFARKAQTADNFSQLSVL